MIGVGTNGELNKLKGDPVWRDRLSSVSGVYIIESGSGSLYVGSASGRGSNGGFLGRWTSYAQTNDTAPDESDYRGLRANTGLRKFLFATGDPKEQRSRLRGLRFSIAKTMDKNANVADILAVESWFKEKLGTRAENLGLNDN